ncbi:hypothetical protein [Dactylosporangium sp. CS-033363]|uniref:hypothetical protein n=1 Tax=Dactylosporangium sp. CS-033363 TaxID=3239935 RepID=UPI003D8DD995
MIDTDDAAGVDLNLHRPHEWIGGPWNGRRTYEPRAFVIGHQCMPGGDGQGPTVWARADAWAGRERYAPRLPGCCDDLVVMEWRNATEAEVQHAIADRDAWYADKWDA